MNFTRVMMALSVSALLTAGTTVLAQDDDSFFLEITEVGVKIGHGPKFREAVKSYNKCLADNEYDGTWSAWRNVDGDVNVYHFVSTMNNWAEMDSANEVGETCWSRNHDQVTAHVDSISVSFARHLPAWSGQAEGFDVVRLHQFRVDDGDLFETTVGAITSIMKEAEYGHMGTWYDVIGSDSNEPDYFVVSHFQNFAALDEDRPGARQVVVDAAGEERADELWEQFGNSLHDDWEYSSQLLRRDVELSHSGDD